MHTGLQPEVIIPVTIALVLGIILIFLLLKLKQFRQTIESNKLQLSLFASENKTLKDTLDSFTKPEVTIDIVDLATMDEDFALPDARKMLLSEIGNSLKTAPPIFGQIDSLLPYFNRELQNATPDWTTILNQLDAIRPTFFKTLSGSSELTLLDQKICAFLVLNLHNKTIAQILQITEASLLNRRSMIRKKIGLTRSDDLVMWLARL